MKYTVIQRLASLIDARARCERDKNVEWFKNHSDAIRQLARKHLPSGSGVDCGTKVDLEKSTPERVVLTTAFHHMNDSGHYDGWTEHDVIVKASLASRITLRVTGRDRNYLKEYLHELYHAALTAELPEKCGEGPTTAKGETDGQDSEA